MKMDKRLLVLNIAVIAVIVFSFIYVWSVGDDYTLHTYVYPEKGIDSAVVDVKDDDVLEFVNLRIENYEMVADFRAGDMGETKVLVSYDDENGVRQTDEYQFEVNEFDTIVDKSRKEINFNGIDVVAIAILLLLVLVEVIMLWMFFDYRAKGKFSHSMIAFGGISIFNLILLGTITYAIIVMGSFTVSEYLILVSIAGIYMLIVLFPIMMLLSILLAISNLWLMRNEGYRPVNALGIFFAIVWFIGSIITLGVLFLPNMSDNVWYSFVVMPLVYIIGYLECMFLSVVACSFLATKYKTPFDRDFIIILGCAIRGDGSLTPLLKGRVDSAVAFEKKQFRETGKHAIFVPSGGQGPDETMSEGEAMENYLKSINIPAERIAREDKSTNTFENMKFSKEVIDEKSGGEEKNIAFATTNYHVFRGYIQANKNKFEAKGISAKTKFYFFPNAFLREFVGLLVDQKWKHLLFILMTVGFFSAIAYFVF